LKFTSGTNLAAAEAGAVEWDGTNLFVTQTTGPTRKTIAYTDSFSSTYQPLDAGLTSIAGLTTSANKMIYTTASDTYATTDLTAAGRAMLDDADNTAQRATLGLGDLATLSAVTTSTITDGTIAAGDIGAGAILKSKLNELRPHEQATPNNTVYVEAGIISVANNAKIEYAGGNSGTFSAVTADSRIDLLTIDSSGALGITPGTQAGSPTAPTYPTDKLVIAEVTVTETGTSVISNSDIKDVRPFLNLGGGSGASSIDSTTANTFTLDSDNTGGNVALKFGTTNNETLTWNNTNARFEMSDDLDISGTLTATNLSGPTSTSGTSNDSFEIDTDDSSTMPILTFGANASSAPKITTQVGPLTLQPASGSGVNVTLATTGDFAVNTNQLYVDTSAGNVGIGTTSPGSLLTLTAGDISIDNTRKLNFEGSTGDTYIARSGAGAMSLYVDGNEIAVFRKQVETR
jgi:hypothetical protein